MNKAQLINHIEHGLIVTGVTFHKPVTKRLTVAQLTERLVWLREYYQARCAPKPVQRTKHCVTCHQPLGAKS